MLALRRDTRKSRTTDFLVLYGVSSLTSSSERPQSKMLTIACSTRASNAPGLRSGSSAVSNPSAATPLARA
jgi:hypothetical protein